MREPNRREVLAGVGAALAGCSNPLSSPTERQNMENEIEETAASVGGSMDVESDLEESAGTDALDVERTESGVANFVDNDEGYQANIWLENYTNNNFGVMRTDEGKFNEEGREAYKSGLTEIVESGLEAVRDEYDARLLDNAPDFPEVNNLNVRFIGEDQYVAHAGFNVEDYILDDGEKVKGSIELDEDEVMDKYRISKQN